MKDAIQPRIAILMPVYNEERTISQSLRSILQQSVPPVSILIGDNCSTDGSIDIARSILHGHSVHYEIRKAARNPRKGKLNINNVLYVLTERLKELNLPEYIAIIDADTVIEHQYLEKLIASFVRDKKLGITGGVLLPVGKLDDPYPLHEFSIPWGSNRIHRARCWFELNRIVDLRKLPLWDTDSALLAHLGGWHVYLSTNARSWALKPDSQMRGKTKGKVDASHGLPLWWALLKSMQNMNPRYFAGYTTTRLSSDTDVKGPLKQLQAIYKSGAHKALRKWLHSA